MCPRDEGKGGSVGGGRRERDESWGWRKERVIERKAKCSTRARTLRMREESRSSDTEQGENGHV